MLPGASDSSDRERPPNGTYFSWNTLSGTALAAGEMREFVLPLPAASAVPLSKVSAIERPPSLTLRVTE